MLLDELVARLTQLPEKSRTEAVDLAVQSTATMAWVPNPGPQTQAFVGEADELFYGGEAGGGKTDLGIGLALTEHKRSLLLRRINKDAVKIKPRIEAILGHDSGYNGQLQRWRLGERQIDIAGCEQESDKQRFKGDPHDLIVFDEGTDFLESQYRFIIGWNRSTDPKQRCRVIVASNPPTTPEGLWVVKYWGPWLDKTHPNPAKPGELRWFTTVGGEDREVDGPGPHMIESEPVYARSRTFIRATLSDNPDLARTNYASVLASLPEELRRAYRDGDFSVGIRDADFQVIPTAWVLAAEARWKPDGGKGLSMTAMALDPAGGGRDSAELARRHGGWYACSLGFANKRAEVWWKFREALDPDQPDGSAIALPPDPELRADLCAPTWKLTSRGILLESKDGSSGFGNLRQRLGRSPGKGDAVVMAWSEGNAVAASPQNSWKWQRPEQRWIV